MDSHHTGNDVKELTLTALVLGGLLSIVMGAANTYLGLKAGMTVSASIPAAVITTAISRCLFWRGTQFLVLRLCESSAPKHLWI